MEEEKEKKEEEQDVVGKNVAITLGCSAGIGTAGAQVVDEIKSWELDLVKTTNQAGIPTGHGNMFENVIVRENPGAHKVNSPGTSNNPLLREKNGVDIRLADGTDIQAKCCKTVEKAVDSMIKDGKFRYEGQTCYVPKGQGEQVKKLLESRGIKARVLESKYTYDEVKELCKPGLKSAKFDAMNPTMLLAAGLVGAIVGGCVYLYIQVNDCRKPWWKKALTATCFGVFSFVAIELLVVGYGQYKRF